MQLCDSQKRVILMMLTIPDLYTCFCRISLNKLQPRFVGRFFNSIHDTDTEQSETPSDKMNFYSQQRTSKISSLLKERNRCQSCWISKSLCICDKAREFATGCPPIKAHIALLMHYKEWGRASNTGKLLKIMSPSTTSISIFGIQIDESNLLKKLNEKPSTVLYPSASSRPASEFQEWYTLHNGNVNICVLDSTWNQSKAMDRLIPENVPRININDMIAGPSLFLSRKQSLTEYKISTIEAVAMALVSLGEDPEALRPYYDALKLSVDSVNLLRGMPEAYGSDIVPTIDDCGGPSPFTTPSVPKPEVCACCGTKGTKLRNMGTLFVTDDELGLDGRRVRVWHCKNCNQKFRV